MIGKKRYSIWINQNHAIAEEPEYRTWGAANEALDGDSEFCIWDHSTTPPTDVTDADPEAMVWWFCQWKPEQILTCTRTWTEDARACIETMDDVVVYASAVVYSANEPTFQQVGEALKVATGVELPSREPEEGPQWWNWTNKEWKEQGNKPYLQVELYGEQCWVYGTIADRDAKRDALIEAARLAGKPEEAQS